MSKKKRILIIDDEPDVITYLSALLEDNGYEITAAKDGNEALAIIRAEKPDAVTLDITMPEKSGVKFYREVKDDDELKEIPIIVVTGISEDFEKFISTRKQVSPPDGYIQKPIDREEMLSTLKKLLS